METPHYPQMIFNINQEMLPALKTSFTRTGLLRLPKTQNTRSYVMDSIKATVSENFGGT